MASGAIRTYTVPKLHRGKSSSIAAEKATCSVWARTNNHCTYDSRSRVKTGIDLWNKHSRLITRWTKSGARIVSRRYYVTRSDCKCLFIFRFFECILHKVWFLSMLFFHFPVHRSISNFFAVSKYNLWMWFTAMISTKKRETTFEPFEWRAWQLIKNALRPLMRICGPPHIYPLKALSK